MILGIFSSSLSVDDTRVLPLSRQVNVRFCVRTYPRARAGSRAAEVVRSTVFKRVQLLLQPNDLMNSHNIPHPCRQITSP